MDKIIDSIYVKEQVLKISNLFNSEEIDETARLSEFVKRDSKLTGTIFLSIFTLGMNLYEKPSLNQLLGLLKVIVPEFQISKEGIHQRINEHAVTFFEFMLSKVINISVNKFDLNLLNQFKRILILDSTIIELPEQLSDLFKGCGGSSSKSSLKIQFCYDFKSGNFFYVIQSGSDSDTKYENSFVDKTEPEDLIIKDMGYFNPQAFIDMSNKGVYFLSRWKSNVEIYIKNVENNIITLDMEKLLLKIDTLTEIEVFIKKESKARLVIEKVPEEVLNIRLRKLNRYSKKQGRQTKALTKLFQGYNIYVSNTDDKLLSSTNFRKLYGIRWQVELIFKNWKSNFNIDKVSGIKVSRIKCMLYARLLLVFISDKIIYHLRNIYWNQEKNEISESKSSKHLIIVFSEILKMCIKKDQGKISILLEQAIDFIGKYCKKKRQKTRANNLDIIAFIPLA